MENNICLRSNNGILAGVCKGFGQRTGIDPWLIRFGFIAGVLFFGTGILLYLILAVGFPKEDQGYLIGRKKILGVCQKISQRTNVEIGIVRSLMVTAALVSLGMTVIGYVAIYLLTAAEKDYLIDDNDPMTITIK